MKRLLFIFLFLLNFIFFGGAQVIEPAVRGDSSLNKAPATSLEPKVSEKEPRLKCDSFILEGTWRLTRLEDFFPNENLSSQMNYTVKIDSSGTMEVSRRKRGAWIKQKDTLHFKMRWLYDAYEYEVDSISCDYLKISRFEHFEPHIEPNSPFPRPDPMGSDYTETFIFVRQAPEE